jgi:hypothetical protein
MRALIVAALACAVFLSLPLQRSHADCTSRYEKYLHVFAPGPPDGRMPVSGIPLFCCDTGLEGTGCPGHSCTQLGVWRQIFTCDGTLVGQAPQAGPFCTCSDHASHGTGGAARYADGGTIFNHCNGLTCPESKPPMCDGKEPALTGKVDEGCGDDEHSCTKAHGQDHFPVNLSSGRVESQPVTLFTIPTPEGIQFGVTLKYDSHFPNPHASRRTIAGVTETDPTIHHSDEVIHDYGHGWRDDFSDRLNISVAQLPSGTITWTNMTGIVTFTNVGGQWKSTGDKFQLTDRGANPSDGFGRWVIQSTDTHAPRRTWAFEELQYTSLDNTLERIGRLKRRSLTAVASSITGYYGFTLTWSADGGLASVTDTLNRSLIFVRAGGKVTGIRYQPKLSSAQFDVASLWYAGPRLDRVEPFGTSAYKRFLYWLAPPTCNNCKNLLTDVIVPGAGTASTPAVEAPIGATEVVLEHHVFEESPTSRPRAIESSGPGRHYSYSWNDATGTGTQFDLNQPTGACSTGCATGTSCLAGTCYVASTLVWDQGLRELMQLRPAGTSSSTGSGNPHSVSALYAPTGSPRASVDPDTTPRVASDASCEETTMTRPLRHHRIPTARHAPGQRPHRSSE